MKLKEELYYDVRGDRLWIRAGHLVETRIRGKYRFVMPYLYCKWKQMTRVGEL